MKQFLKWTGFVLFATAIGLVRPSRSLLAPGPNCPSPWCSALLHNQRLRLTVAHGAMGTGALMDRPACIHPLKLSPTAISMVTGRA